MIFPAISRNLGILSGHGEQFSPELTATIEGIFAEHPENLAQGVRLIKELTFGADGEITANMTIAEVKRMVMQSADRYLAETSRMTVPDVVAARGRFEQLAEATRT